MGIAFKPKHIEIYLAPPRAICFVLKICTRNEFVLGVAPSKSVFLLVKVFPNKEQLLRILVVYKVFWNSTAIYSCYGVIKEQVIVPNKHFLITFPYIFNHSVIQTHFFIRKTHDLQSKGNYMYFIVNQWHKTFNGNLFLFSPA